jgi:hypothetical protein
MGWVTGNGVVAPGLVAGSGITTPGLIVGNGITGLVVGNGTVIPELTAGNAVPTWTPGTLYIAWPLSRTQTLLTKIRQVCNEICDIKPDLKSHKGNNKYVYSVDKKRTRCQDRQLLPDYTSSLRGRTTRNGHNRYHIFLEGVSRAPP